MTLRLGDTPLQRFIAGYLGSKLAVAAFAVLLAMVLVALFAPVLTPQNPYDLTQLNILDGRLPPGSEGFGGMTYWLGTDDQGRDLVSAIAYGLRISLSVGTISTVTALLIGTTIGLLAGFFGGRLDSVLMRIVDIQLSFPAILTALILIALLGKGLDKVIIALVTIQWAYYARTVRGGALLERRKEYVEAARCLKLPTRRIIFRHILPNCLGPLIVIASVQIAQAIILEATLSFLGLGLPVTQPSLGLLVANGFAFVMSGKLWISFFPGLALLVTIVSINLVADRLRDVLNPRLQG